MTSIAPAAVARPATKRLNVFERYLSLWVALCMLIGVLLGQAAPGVVQILRQLEFGSGSQVNVPIAVLIWLMIVPMMMKVDFTSVRNVGKRPRGLLVMLFVNWLVKPFSMAVVAWLFFRHVFAPSTSTSAARRGRPSSSRCATGRESPVRCLPGHRHTYTGASMIPP